MYKHTMSWILDQEEIMGDDYDLLFNYLLRYYTDNEYEDNEALRDFIKIVIDDCYFSNRSIRYICERTDIIDKRAKEKEEDEIEYKQIEAMIKRQTEIIDKYKRRLDNHEQSLDNTFECLLVALDFMKKFIYEDLKKSYNNRKESIENKQFIKYIFTDNKFTIENPIEKFRDCLRGLVFAKLPREYAILITNVIDIIDHRIFEDEDSYNKSIVYFLDCVLDSMYNYIIDYISEMSRHIDLIYLQ